MIIKVKFEGDFDFDYIYCPDSKYISKYEIKQSFYNWIDYTEDEHPFWCYENGQRNGICYRGEAIVYWLNKYILKYSDDKAKLIHSFVSHDLNYDLKIDL